jgi:integrase
MSSEQPTQSTSLETAVTAYLDDRTKHTGDGNYHATATSALNQWVAWNKKRGTTSLDDLTPTDIRRYIQDLNSRSDSDALAASTIHTYFNIIRGCLSWCVTDSRLDVNPADSHPAIEALPDDTQDPDTTQQFWTETQIQHIIRHVNQQAHTAIDNDGLNASTPVRDRALATTLTFSGARGAELFSSPHDSRKGRNGITWKRVDLDAGTITVLGKNQNWEPAQLPEQAKHALEQHYRVQNPASDDWPVFPSGHAPTLYNTARETLAEHGYSDEEIDTLVTEADSAQALLREHDIAPPPLTTEGARSVMKRLCDDANIDVDGDYLKPHGARRGLGNILYKQQAELAQTALRHESVETTHDAYSHITASETSDTVSNVLNTTLNDNNEDDLESSENTTD